VGARASRPRFKWRVGRPPSRRLSRRVGQFFADRLRDLKSIADNLDTIVNQGAAQGAYEPGVSKVALAGHSFGAVTTILASGIPWKKGDVVLNMEAAPYNFRRIDNGGTPSDISDDSGPFIDAVAFLDISETTFDGVETTGSPPVFDPTVHTLLDAGRPNLTGRDMISKPFMLIAGSKDILADTNGNLTSNIANARLYDPVTEPYGLHDAARYGVIIDGANHLTAVGWFNDSSVTYRSWVFQDVWNFILLFIKGKDSLMPEEDAFFDGGSFEAKLEETIDAMFKDTSTAQQTEEERLAKMQEYSLAFWDAYLSPRYDVIAGKGSEFLSLPVQDHWDDIWIFSDEDLDIHGFVRRDPVSAFTVKDNAGTPLVQFQSDGNVLISSGGFSENQSITTSPVNR
jgi:hypothetical protein